VLLFEMFFWVRSQRISVELAVEGLKAFFCFNWAWLETTLVNMITTEPVIVLLPAGAMDDCQTALMKQPSRHFFPHLTRDAKDRASSNNLKNTSDVFQNLRNAPLKRLIVLNIKKQIIPSDANRSVLDIPRTTAVCPIRQ